MATDINFSNYYAELRKRLINAQSQDLYSAIVNTPFHNKLYATTLDLGVISLIISDEKSANYMAVADTEPAQSAGRMSPIPFTKIKIPLEYSDNAIVKAIKTGQQQKISDWQHLLCPVMPVESARFNQSAGGIACSFVQPLTHPHIKGALVFCFYQPLDSIDDDRHIDFMLMYTDLVSEILI